MRRRRWGRRNRWRPPGGPRRPRLRRGIYLLPSAFTVGNIFCGYLAVIHAMRGEFETAAFLVLLATVLDFLDGKVARLTRSTTPFGIEFDSLADLISFGVAPAVIVHSWGLTHLGRIGWTASFLYVICSATRLARFNIQLGHSDRRFFVGLPIPAAAAVLAANVFYHPAPVQDRFNSILLCFFLVLVSVLMVSRTRYRSFKEIDFRRRKPYIYIVGFALVVAGVASAPQQTLLVVCYAYLVSGLVPRSLPALFAARAGREKAVQVESDGSNDST